VLRKLLCAVTLTAPALLDWAMAADLPVQLPVQLPVKAPPAPPASDWTGAYLGGYAGWSLSPLGITTNPVTGEDLLIPGFQSTGLLAGLQLGYNYQLANRIVLGAEADVTFSDIFATRTMLEAVSGQSSQLIANLKNFGTVRGRIGYAFDRFLPYVTGGLAWGYNRVERDILDETVSSKSLKHVGWTIGAGFEWVLGGPWSAKVEYNYIDLGAKTYTGLFLDDAAQSVGTFDPKVHAFKLGLNYRLGDHNEAAGHAAGEVDLSGWSIHGQSTFIEQAYPSFRSTIPDGPNSLFRFSQAKETFTATAFIGRKLWEGGEVYFNPEIDQGFGLSDTVGVADFPNGEAQKSSFTVPRPNVARLYLRQTFGLGGEQETVEDGPNQIAGTRDISRVTFTVGKIAVVDIFNQNAYANDPRSQFLSWNMWGTGAYDYAADRVGITWGAIAELNQKDWALRAGYFLIPIESNVDLLDHPPRGQYVAELEERYTLFGQPGKLRLLGWLSHANMGSYEEAVAETAITMAPANIVPTRQLRNNFGALVNVEQAIGDELGVFSRASWNPGQTEVMAWTEADQTFSLGAQLKGKAWGRPDDRIGVAGLIEGLSASARAYFAAGGTGVIIGDGQLNYRPEQVFEVYYALALNKWATLTLDWQYVVNPAYNTDRGPVSIWATRLHAEF
jgi:high affinity Mn2+ porin